MPRTCAVKVSGFREQTAAFAQVFWHQYPCMNVDRVSENHRLVDFYHLTEKLGAAAQVVEDSAAAAGERLGGWKKALLHRSRAPTDILQELIASGRDEGVGTDHPVHEAITYLQSHGPLFTASALKVRSTSLERLKTSG